MLIVFFCLPGLNPVNPVNSKTLNYASAAFGFVLVYALGFWVISARKWFTGPVKRIERKTCWHLDARLCDWKHNRFLRWGYQGM